MKREGPSHQQPASRQDSPRLNTTGNCPRKKAWFVTAEPVKLRRKGRHTDTPAIRRTPIASLRFRPETSTLQDVQFLETGIWKECGDAEGHKIFHLVYEDPQTFMEYFAFIGYVILHHTQTVLVDSHQNINTGIKGVTFIQIDRQSSPQSLYWSIPQRTSRRGHQFWTSSGNCLNVDSH